MHLHALGDPAIEDSLPGLSDDNPQNNHTLIPQDTIRLERRCDLEVKQCSCEAMTTFDNCHSVSQYILAGRE